MEVNGIISSLSPVITASKRAETESAPKARVAKIALDVQREAGEAIIRAVEKAAQQTGKGINIDLMG